MSLPQGALYAVAIESLLFVWKQIFSNITSNVFIHFQTSPFFTNWFIYTMSKCKLSYTYDKKHAKLMHF
jgi:hypothetical protein